MRLYRLPLSGALLFAALVATSACHTPPREFGVAGSGDNVITRDELDSAGTASVYDVIVRRHALFLKDRGPSSIYGLNTSRALVFIGDTEYGVIETLHNLPAERYEQVRYFNGPEASAKWGSRYIGGVIQLIPRYQ